MSDSDIDNHPKHARLVAKMLLVVVGMFGFGFAMVPLYDVICEVTGLNGKTGRAAEAALAYVPDESRTLKVEFVSVLNSSMPLEFHPVVKTMEINPGKVYETRYSATNGAGRDLIGQAVPSVVPGAAASYFQKTECFCFTRQEFKAGESRDMPLRFVVDPAIPKYIKTLTLSYTFFDITDKDG